MRQKSKSEMLPHVDHLSSLLIQRQRSVEQYCGKQQVYSTPCVFNLNNLFIFVK